jgi:glycosyltransferase involved in cell wall biosynthesis
MNPVSSQKPRVAVVVLAFRQAIYLKACLASLAEQDLENVQVILVDNGSQDGTAAIMQAWAKENPSEVMLLPRNIGHCKGFNLALEKVKAPFVVDLAGDDVLLQDSINIRAAALENNSAAAFCHTNVAYVNAKGTLMGYEHQLGESNPAWQGMVWQRLFEGRFISPPTVMFRTEYLKAAEGYDESLSFEDFDIWMRLARKHPIVYLPEVTMQYRQHPGSASSGQVYRRTQAFLESVLTVCQKGFQMALTDGERLAIGRFARYHLRLAAYTGYPSWVHRYHTWLRESELPRPVKAFWMLLARLPVRGFYKLYADRIKKQNLF